MKFNKWLDTLVEEKGIDTNDIFEIEGHIFEYGFIIESIKMTSEIEQQKIKDTLVKIDFMNGDIKHYFRHLGKVFI